MPSRIAAINGAASSVDSHDNTVAPRNAPTAPGTPSLATSRQSMLREAPVRQTRGERGTDLGEVNRCAGLGRTDIAEHEQRDRGDPEGHSEGAVDKLGPDADERER